jgi:hypothetical protein
MSARPLISTIAAAALSVFAFSGAASAMSEPTFEEAFAAAETVSYKARVVTTNPARNEIIVKAKDRNEFAVPVQAGFDIASVRENQFLNVTYLAGVVIDIEKSKNTKPEIDASKTVVLADEDRLARGPDCPSDDRHGQDPDRGHGNRKGPVHRPGWRGPDLHSAKPEYLE